MRKIVYIFLFLSTLFTFTYSNSRKIEITICIDDEQIAQIQEKVDSIQKEREIQNITDMAVLFFQFVLEKQIEKLAGVVCELIYNYFSGKDFEETERGKKEKETAAAIFGAIASACLQTGAILASETEEEQQQGVLNLFATAFNLASQLIKSQRFDLQNREKIIELTVQLVDELSKRLKKDGRLTETEFLCQLDKLQTQAEKIAWVKQNLNSKELMEKFLNEVFECLKNYLLSQLDNVLNLCSKKILEILFGKKGQVFSLSE